MSSPAKKSTQKTTKKPAPTAPKQPARRRRPGRRQSAKTPAPQKKPDDPGNLRTTLTFRLKVVLNDTEDGKKPTPRELADLDRELDDPSSPAWTVLLAPWYPNFNGELISHRRSGRWELTWVAHVRHVGAVGPVAPVQNIEDTWDAGPDTWMEGDIHWPTHPRFELYTQLDKSSIHHVD